MSAWRAHAGLEASFHPRSFCVETCSGEPRACETAREMMTMQPVQRTVARMVLSLVEDASALDRTWGDLLIVLRARRPHDVDEPALVRALAGHAADWYARRRGGQAGWSYRDADRLRRLLVAVLLEKAANPGAVSSMGPRREFAAFFRELHRQSCPPYPGCDAICTEEPAMCLYRYAVADLVASQRYQYYWAEADAADRAAPERGWSGTLDLCERASYELIEYPSEDVPPPARDAVAAASRRLGLCFEQQMLAADENTSPQTARATIAAVLAATAPGAAPVDGSTTTQSEPLAPARSGAGALADADGG
jgi:hypothetical protein